MRAGTYDSMRLEIEALKRRSVEVRRMICESEMQCNHIQEEELNECGNIDDCLFHSIIRELDDGATNSLEQGVRPDAAAGNNKSVETP